VELLGDVLREPDRRHLDGIDSGESQKVRAAKGFALGDRVIETDVDSDRLEAPAGELGFNVVSNSRTSDKLVKVGSALDDEHEEIAEVSGLSLEEVVGGGMFVIASAEVHVPSPSR
jgi:hypothetical protein